MQIKCHNKKFRALSNSSNGEIDSGLVFHYQQAGAVLSCHYGSENISQGHLLGLVDDQGGIKMCYHQINKRGELFSGKCTSTPEIMPNGKIRLLEKWQWTTGDGSSGESVLEEI